MSITAGRGRLNNSSSAFFWVWSEFFKDLIRSCHAQSFPWTPSSPDGPALSFGKLLHVKPGRELMVRSESVPSLAPGKNGQCHYLATSQRENLGAAGSLVCDSGGDNHNIQHVYNALQFQRLFYSLQRQFAHRLQGVSTR